MGLRRVRVVSDNVKKFRLRVIQTEKPEHIILQITEIVFCPEVVVTLLKSFPEHPLCLPAAAESLISDCLCIVGGIGYPVIGHTWEIDRKWGYGKNKKSSEEVMKQYEEYAEMLKVFVQTGCAAAVYTQTTDVEGEVNGLMTYDRAVIKVDIPAIAEINRSVIESMSR